MERGKIKRRKNLRLIFRDFRDATKIKLKQMMSKITLLKISIPDPKIFKSGFIQKLNCYIFQTKTRTIYKEKANVREKRRDKLDKN